jgi:hypothetical protein
MSSRGSRAPARRRTKRMHLATGAFVSPGAQSRRRLSAAILS